VKSIGVAWRDRGGAGSGAIVLKQAVGLVVPVTGNRRELLPGTSAVVGAEQKLASKPMATRDVGLGATAVAAV
jgi:hypothetical protein